MTTPLRLSPDGVLVRIKLTPGAKSPGIKGIALDAHGDAVLKAAVTAIPEDGKANTALVALIAKSWKLPKSSVRIVQGDTSRDKTLLIAGDGDALMTYLSAKISG